MILQDTINQLKYRDELLNYIHKEINTSNITNVQKLELIKEHKRISESIYKDFYIEKFNSEMTINAINLEKMKILQEKINDEFKGKNYVRKQVFCFICYNLLNIKASQIALYLDIDKRNFYSNLNSFKVKYDKKHRFKSKYNDFIDKYKILSY